MQSLQRMSPVLSLSPSFNSYSSANLADIAARVVQEFRHENPDLDDSDIYDWEVESLSLEDEQEQQDKEEEEFEFSFCCKKPDTSPISADEIFLNGQIKPTYPLFDTTLISQPNTTPKKHRLPLRTLMNEDRQTATTTTSSCSSSELDSVEPGTYCVWKPSKESKESPNGCKKSNSTGSSKRWKFRDLLYRSNSDGKDTFVFLTPKNNNNNNKGKVAAIEEHYVKNRDGDSDKKRSTYLPYRQDLVGIFSNVNGLSKNLHPF